MRCDHSFVAVLAAAQQGDDWAVAVLYRDLQPRLSRFLASREPKAAEDLEAEVWLAIAQGIGRFSGDEESFRAWAFSIARRRLADFRRTAIRRATVPVAVEELDRNWAVGADAIALDQLSTEAATKFVIATLPPEQAEVVLLRVVGDLSVTEVGKILGKRPGTVRVLQHRALRRLHAALLLAGVTR
jgi:RNA polymerase sigma-70 factor (ECF subfamily)